MLYRPSLLFYPIELHYQDVTQSNVAPGFGMLKVPSQLQGNAKMISAGSTFSVAIDENGNVYEWGTFPTEKLKNIPSSSEMGKLTQISAGLDHVLAVNERARSSLGATTAWAWPMCPWSWKRPPAHQADFRRLPDLSGPDGKRAPV